MNRQIKKNTRYKILTDIGFKPFSGISLQPSNNANILTAEKSSIVATGDHRFKNIDDAWICVNDMTSDTVLQFNGRVTDCVKLNDTVNVYDVLDVEDANSFITNGFNSHNCEFIGSSATLISSEALLGLKGHAASKTQYGIKYYYDPVEGHDYIMTVDVSKGRGQDYSTFTVVDISEPRFTVVCTFRDNTISPLMFPELIFRAATTYNNAMLVVENNDAGQVVCNALYYDYEYQNMFVSSAVKSNGIGVTMTKRVKRIGCSNLKDLIENGKLQICDIDTIAELSSFEPKGDSYAARGSTHDDMVMNLVLFAWFVSTDAFGEISQVDLKNLLYSEKIREMEEDLPMFGLLSSYSHDAPASAVHYEQQRQELDEWNSL